MSNEKSCVARLVLGTAQLGMAYGVANRRGQPSPQEALAMLEQAERGGIRCLDTAAGYGAAEQLIGRYLRERKRPAELTELAVVTKLTLADGRTRNDESDQVHTALLASRQRLGRAPDAALLHDPNLLDHWDGPLGDALRSCRAAGDVAAIGASVYTPDQFERALELEGLEVLQAPFNVFDRRLEQGGLLARAQAQGVRVMLRSAFLQGLLTLEPTAYPRWLSFAAELLRRWRAACVRHSLEPRHVALRFVLERTAPAEVVVGCESPQQLQQLLHSAAGPSLPGQLVDELEELASDDARLLDPREWPA
jgi:aryl-alcohol dehydrogenase-like predicted oxidoreductase